MAQSVKLPTLAQVTISRFMSSSPASAQNPKPASDSVSPSLSAPLLPSTLCLSLKNKHKKKTFNREVKYRGCWIVNGFLGGNE